MNVEEAKQSKGKEFKLSWASGGILGRFDTIRYVDADGWIHGDFLSAPADDCRLKQEQPPQLKGAAQTRISFSE
jgi:hypothetical protein